MLIDIIDFYSTETTWTLEAEIDGKPVTVQGGFWRGYADFGGVKFNGLPIGRTTFAVNFLMDRLDGQHVGRTVPLAVTQQDRFDAEYQFFYDF